MGYISVDRAGKAYKQYPSKLAKVIDWFTPIEKHSKKWVLKDVSFNIGAGESVAIIGVNGAGKSTLLKMITGTTKPNAGTIDANGRIAALLELGMGFHPDFTGRQNVYMAGQIQGMTVDEINSVFDDIISFADIGDYIDQPVRVYSSGMQVRLAFAVATAIRPDILIVDEALSVGDAAFQRKCYRKIEYFQEKGTTLLFVTHDIETVKRLCQKAIFIHNGTLFNFGPAKTVCDQYEEILFGGSKTTSNKKSTLQAIVDPGLMSDCEVAYGDGRATIEKIWFENHEGKKSNIFECSQKFSLNYRVKFNQDVSDVQFSFMIKTKDGVSLFGTDTSHLNKIKNKHFSAGDEYVMKFEIGNSFAPGAYYINCGLRDDTNDVPVFLHRRIDSAIFKVIADETTATKSGLLNFPVKFSLDTSN